MTTRSKLPRWLWASIGGVLLLALCICAPVASGGGALLWRSIASLGEPRYPEEQISVVEDTRLTIGDAGAEVQLGGLIVTVPGGAVGGEATLYVAEARRDSAPVEPPSEVIGSTYVIEWEPGSAACHLPTTIAFAYDPGDLPSGTAEESLAVYTFDGTDWLRLPSVVDTAAHTVRAEVMHFSWFSWGAWAVSRFNPQYLEHDVPVNGQIQYTLGAYPGDPQAQTSPATGLRFAVIDGDMGLLQAGYLDSEGRFEIIIPEGADVGFDFNVFVRVYADEPQVGTVKALGSGPYSYSSETPRYEPAHIPGVAPFGLVTIPYEESGAFNILSGIEAGYSFIEAMTGQRPPPAAVIWAGPSASRYNPMLTGFGEDEGRIYISGNPQNAYDRDLVLRMYGHYARHWLYDGERLGCSSQPTSPDALSDPCRAWLQGWSYFFSSAVRGEASYEVYANKSQPEETFDLDSGQYPLGESSSGAVMQTLWQLTGSGTNLTEMQRVFGLLSNHGAQINSLNNFYLFWDSDFGLTDEECQPFVRHEIVESRECAAGVAAQPDATTEPPGPAVSPTELPTETPYYELPTDTPEAEPTQVDVRTISYGDEVNGAADASDADLWEFEGQVGDYVKITVRAAGVSLDPMVTLAWAESGAVLVQNFDAEDAEFPLEPTDAQIAAFELPDTGTYEILVSAQSGSGGYFLELELANPPASAYSSLESYNYPGYYIRHSWSLGELTQILSGWDQQDASFRLAPGLADPNCVSLESLNYPRHYLRHSDYRIRLDAWEDSDLFIEDATFCRRAGLADSSWVSFESYNYPGYYIRHRDYHLYLEQGSGSPFAEDATFRVVEPALPATEPPFVPTEAPPSWPTEAPPGPLPPGLGTGDVQITLLWHTSADLDLFVYDPDGNVLYFDRRSAPNGGQLDRDANRNCEERADQPVENIFWPPGQAPNGHYDIRVYLTIACGSPLPVPYELILRVDGQVYQHMTGTVDRELDYDDYALDY